MKNIHRTRRRDMLAAVLAAGGCLDVSEWRALGLRYGYDPHGLAGYFGGQYPSMFSDGPRRCLTDRGRHRAGSAKRSRSPAQGPGSYGVGGSGYPSTRRGRIPARWRHRPGV